MANTPILSICIPTYNRADILRRSLHVLTNNEVFDDQTEVVIVDNCSTDHTPSVIQYYSNKYKNIISYRNAENIGFNNGERVLSLANGKYLKLINDYVIIDNDCLHFILNEIRDHLKDQTPLFFLNGMAYSDLKKIYCESLNDYINRVSIFVTYWPFFGVWKEHWEQLTEKNKYSESLIPQDYWTYKIIVNNGKCLIYNNRIFNFIPDEQIGIRKGYNWFEIFFDNYFEILFEFKSKGYIDDKTLKADKRKVFLHFRSQLAMACFVRYNKYWGFDTKGTYKKMWIHYKKEPILYVSLLLAPLVFVFTVYKYIILNINKKNR